MRFKRISLVYSGCPWIPMMCSPYLNISTPVLSERAITSASGGSSHTYTMKSNQELIPFCYYNCCFQIFDSRIVRLCNLVAMTFDDGEVRWDSERREQVVGVQRVDAGDSYIPSFVSSASFASQCPAQNL